MARNATKNQPTADVAPRAEVEWLEKENARLLNLSEYNRSVIEQEITDAKAEVEREIFEELYKSVASKTTMQIRPIFKDDLNFEDGFRNGKNDAFLEVLLLIAELKKKYIGEQNDGRN